MSKLPIVLFSLAVIFCSCNNQASHNRKKAVPTNQRADNTNYKGLRGTWVRHNKTGFTLIEINDTSNVLYYEFGDRNTDLGKPNSDRFWYYKSKASMGYRNGSNIWITTDKFRFDYKLKGDTLIEFDKMGYQGAFVKVQTDEEKSFADFNAANLRDKIKFLTKVEQSNFFILNNKDWEYSFIPKASSASNDKVFSDIATIGDSIIKPAYAVTLTLYKKNSKQYFKFTFVRR
jgi:hypothetical protein